jgi:hypothetical protein
MKTKLVVDSGQPVNYRRVYKSISRALEHFGVYYEIIDLSRQRISHEELADTHLLVLGQEGIGKSLNVEETNAILKMLFRGMGLLVLDGYLDWYPPSFLNALGIEKGISEKISLLKIHPDNRIVNWIAQQEITLKNPVLGYPVPVSVDWSPLLLDGENNVCGLYKKTGKGRVVFFLVSASLWQDENLGFTQGLDGLFRNSISWSAKKPFITKAMPPFITARIDDVSFSGSPAAIYKETVEELRWLDIFNRYGFIPNAGLFIDDIQDRDLKYLREKHHDGLAEFSTHAFKDPENVNEFPVYMKHNGEEFSEGVLEKNFEKVDRRFSEWAVTPSKTVNAHFGEIGLRALPYLKKRGQRYLMNPIRVGKPWSDPSAHSWNMEPYNKPSFSFSPIPEDKDFFNVTSHPGIMDSNVPDMDFLCKCTRFWNESSSINVKKAIERGVFQIARGLENGFFGCLMLHEQRIGYIPLKHWEEIVGGISDGIKNIPHTFKSYDYISSYAENRTFYRIEKAEYNKELSVWLKGRNDMLQYLSLFLDEDGKTRESFLEVPEFEKAIELNFKIPG